jgi:predicted nuclease of predicted toxin-antitoxin system
MSVIRLYFDADSMERAIVSGLRARGIDAISAQEVAMADRSDDEQLEFSRAQERVLFSFNVSDFQRLHTEYLTQEKPHAGIILAVQQRYSVGERIRRLQALIATRTAEEMQNRLEFLGDWN